MRKALMQTYLSNILKAGLKVFAPAELLAALPCIPALEELENVRSAKEWSQAVQVAATEPGHLEVVQWAFSKGIIGRYDLAQPACNSSCRGRQVGCSGLAAAALANLADNLLAPNCP